jgi:hypothetical protein
LICCVTSYLLDGTAVLSETDCILYYPASVVQKLCPTRRAAPGASRPAGVTPLPDRVQLRLTCETIEKMRRNSWAEETEATSQAGAVEAGTADAETDPEASEIVRARAAVVAGTRTGPGIVRSGRKSASNAGRSASNTARSARSTGKRGRSGGKSASNAGRTASKRAEIPEAVEIPSAAEAPDSVQPGSPAGAPTTTLPARKAERRP